MNVNVLVGKNMLHEQFKGTVYRLADIWYQFLDYSSFANRPINYVEVGTYYGGNLFSVANTFGSHKDSKLYAIDVWCDYSEYSQYKNEQDSIYNEFINNLNNFKDNHKITVMRGFSNEQLLKLPDNNFDIIYIDGNHEPEYVLEDAVLSFRKLKQNGYLIFDDYGWGGPDLTQRGIDAFLSGYYKRVKIVGEVCTQMFCQKL